jgi:hypothetical protein
MKKVILLFLLLVSTLIMFGQKKPVEKATTVGFNILVPTGNLSDTNPYGLGMNIETEIIGKNNVGITLNTGYNYYRGDGESNSLIQFPALVGVKYHFGGMVAFGQQFGVSYITQGYGVRFTYSTYLSFGWNKVYSDFRFISSTTPGHENDISGLCLRISYKL